ncbi:PH domain-containing protein [Alteromonadaceae bacterium M269]|nr:PH domain-containing protein [Alteromonadaceae bacterium M269]
MNETVIDKATFDKKVKQYWLVYWLFFSSILVISIPLIPIVIVVVLLVSQKILNAMSAELLERKLVVKRGILFKVEKSIPLEKITDVGMVQGPLMRFFNLYRLNFETAGQSGTGALVSMIGIVDAANFRERILTQKDELQMLNTTSEKASPESPNDLKELVESVKRIEALLEKQLNKL